MVPLAERNPIGRGGGVQNFGIKQENPSEGGDMNFKQISRYLAAFSVARARKLEEAERERVVKQSRAEYRKAFKEAPNNSLRTRLAAPTRLKEGRKDRT